MFYITSQLKLYDNLKVGSRFSKGQILAYDPNFFGPQGGELSYKAGTLARTAIVTTDQTYEDSIMVSRKLTEDTSSYVTVTREVGLGPKANLQRMVSVGDTVQPNTPLAVFENMPEDAGTSEILSRIGAEYDQVITELATNVARARDAGEVVEIKAYYNRELNELSASLRAAVQRLSADAESRLKATAGAPGDEPVRVTAPERVMGDKVLGKNIDGVLFIFYIRTKNEAGPGDKYTTSATKGIVSRVFERGEEPVTEDGRTIDFVMSPLSTVSRMTNDVYMSLWTHSTLVGLKEKVAAIFDED